ncbi:MAG: hypothetical protein ACRDYC_10160 [Acidimicrobiales bacterium]
MALASALSNQNGKPVQLLSFPIKLGDWALRVLAAGGVGAMGGIHLYLWDSVGYRYQATIGALFMLDVVLSAVFALAILLTPRRFVAIATLSSGVLVAGTIIAQVISVSVGLFGFVDSIDAPMARAAIGVEGLALLLLLAAAYVVPHGEKS